MSTPSLTPTFSQRFSSFSNSISTTGSQEISSPVVTSPSFRLFEPSQEQQVEGMQSPDAELQNLPQSQQDVSEIEDIPPALSLPILTRQNVYRSGYHSLSFEVYAFSEIQMSPGPGVQHQNGFFNLSPPALLDRLVRHFSMES